MSSSEQNPADIAVVLDNGSGMVKAGFAGEEVPAVVFPAIVGRPKVGAVPLHGTTFKSEYIGDEAIKMQGVLNLKYPIESGIVNDWDDMEKVWHNTFFNELRVEPSEIKGVLLTEAPQCPKINREKMCTMMFETFNVQRVYVAIQAVMSLYSAGRTTGLVVDSGDGVSHTAPVFEGFKIEHAISRIPIAGRVLSKWMQKLLLEAGFAYASSSEMQIVKSIKEKCCYAAQDYNTESEEAKTSSEHDMEYTLPNLEKIVVPGSARIKCPELLFRPDMNGHAAKSIQDLTWDSVQACEIEIRKDLAKSILMSGGSTMFEGVPDRLKREIEQRAPAGSEIRVIAAADRKYAVWKGGSTLCSLQTFEGQWVTREEYEEHGVPIIHRKCQ